VRRLITVNTDTAGIQGDDAAALRKGPCTKSGPEGTSIPSTGLSSNLMQDYATNRGKERDTVPRPVGVRIWRGLATMTTFWGR